MSNASLKEQLQAVASQLSDTVTATAVTASKAPHTVSNERKVKKPFRQVDRPSRPSTASKPKPKWLDYVQYGVELLKVYFPSSFKATNDVKPLQKGIKQDLVRRLSTIDTIVTDDKACMVKSLAFYVNTAAYHRSVVEGATRIDLDGNPAGVVTAEEAKYSIDRHQAKLLAKQESKSVPLIQSKDVVTQ